MEKIHSYHLFLEWTGNRGPGTSGYRDYGRDHTISIKGKAPILGSSDPAFRGNPALHNPEDLLLAAIASCHMLWYLSLCSEKGVIVLKYSDHPVGRMLEKKDGSGHFTEVTLHPQIEVAHEAMIADAERLHQDANQYCFVAASVNFPIHHQPVIKLYPGIL
jgi:organic hydroperoxide reductase OsmC/OhrA